MSSVEWSRYVRDQLGVEMDPEEISREVADRVADVYREKLPLLPGAVEAVKSLAKEWPLGLASSSNRHVIDLVLELAGIADAFAVTVSSEEVGAGKPAPDVYLETAKRLGKEAPACVAVEDSTNGIRSAHAAGMAVIAVPNQDFPPESDALELADVTVKSLTEVTPETVRPAPIAARLVSFRPTGVDNSPMLPTRVPAWSSGAIRKPSSSLQG